jgi:hypothetical protein
MERHTGYYVTRSTINMSCSISHHMNENDGPFSEKPIRQDGVVYCCSCEPDIGRPVKKTVTGRFGTEYVDKEMVWCTRCGRPLTNKQMDMFAAKLRGELE